METLLQPDVNIVLEKTKLVIHFLLLEMHFTLIYIIAINYIKMNWQSIEPFLRLNFPN